MYKMNLGKRYLAIVLVLAFVISFTACSGAAKTGQSSTAPAKSAEVPKVTEIKYAPKIDLWMTFGSGVNAETLKKQVDSFNTINKGKIEVEATFQGNYADCLSKYITAYAAQQTPVVGVCDAPDSPQIIKMGMIQNLNPLIARDKLDVSDFIEGFLTYSKKDGNMYAMPFARSTPVMYYNKELFQKALGHTNAPKTWDDLYKYGKGIQEYAKKENLAGTWGTSIDLASWYYSAFISQLGGRLLSEDGNQAMFTKDDAGLKSLEFWRQLVDEGMFFVPGSTSTKTSDQFIAGKIGILQTSTGSMGSIIKNAKFDVGVTEMPKNKTTGFSTGGGNLIIFKDATVEETNSGWEFIKYLTSAKVNAEFSMATGYCITHKSAANLDEVKKFWQENPGFKVAFDQLQYVNDTYVSTNWAECNLATVKILTRLLQDKSINAKQADQEMINAYSSILPNGVYKK